MTRSLQILPARGEGDRAQRGGGGYWLMRRPETYAARRLRRDMTLPEVLLWQALRTNQAGLRFRRQHVVGPYVVDFYCPAAKLAIEVDGMVHELAGRAHRDAVRNGFLVERGLTVVRVSARDVLRDAGAVAASLVQSAIPLRQALRACHLPMNGEDA